MFVFFISFIFVNTVNFLFFVVVDNDNNDISDKQFQGGFAQLFEELQQTEPELHKWWTTVVSLPFHLGGDSIAHFTALTLTLILSSSLTPLTDSFSQNTKPSVPNSLQLPKIQRANYSKKKTGTSYLLPCFLRCSDAVLVGVC